MRILIITSAYPSSRHDPRGCFIHLLARALVREGLDVTVLAPGARGAASTEMCDGVKVQRVTYWISRWQGLAEGGGIMPNLRRNPLLLAQVPTLVTALIVRAKQIAAGFDLIHAHWVYPAGVAGTVAARRSALPLVITGHGGDLNQARNSRVLGEIARRVSLTADVCIGVSHAMVEEFRALGVSSSRVKFLPLGVEVHRSENSLPASEWPTHVRPFRTFSGPRIIYVGNLIASKSVLTLLEAHAQLEERGLTLATLIVGGGPTEPSLRNFVQRHSLGNVFFAGTSQHELAIHYMAAADVLVLPSLSEGRGLVIVEAMSLGLPVVASDIPGPRELVVPEETGLLFPAQNSTALAYHLERLIRDEPLRRAMGQNARAAAAAQGLTTEECARQHRELYASLLASKRSKSGKEP